MRLLLCSDAHADHVTAGFRRHEDVRRAMLRTVEVAVERDVDAWAFLGDLCDPDLRAPETIRAIELALDVAGRLGAAKIPNFWVAGNHDVVEDGSGTTTLSPLKAAGLSHTMVFEEPEVVRDWHATPAAAGFSVMGLPFPSRRRAYDPDEHVRRHAVLPPEERMPDHRRDTWVFLSHLQLEGADLGSETLDMPRGRDVAFPTEAVKLFDRRFCAQGHYHRRQVVGEVQVVGALERLTFGEQSHEPGFLIVEVS